MRALPLMLASIGLSCAGIAASTAANAQEWRSSVFGRVEVVPGVRADNCTVYFEGAPIETKCNATGTFEERRLPPGTWSMRIVVAIPGSNEKLEQRLFGGADEKYHRHDIGVVVMSRGVTIVGRVRGVTSVDHGEYFVTIPALGLVAPLSLNGTYVLTGVPPGQHRAEVRMFTPPAVQAPRRRMEVNLTVGNVKLLKAEEFDLTRATLPAKGR